MSRNRMLHTKNSQPLIIKPAKLRTRADIRFGQKEPMRRAGEWPVKRRRITANALK